MLSPEYNVDEYRFTVMVPASIRCLCVSVRANASVVLRVSNERKVMTDSNELVPTEVEIVDDRIECEICHKPYARHYYGSHLRDQHGIYGGKSGIRRSAPRVQCVKCGNYYQSTGIYTHMRNAHGIYGGKSSIEALRRDPEAKVPTLSTRVQPHHQGFVKSTPTTRSTQPSDFPILPFVVLEDGNGSIWIAEKIRDAT